MMTASRPCFTHITPVIRTFAGSTILFSLLSGCTTPPSAAPIAEPVAEHAHVHEQHHWEIASADPDRIFLTFYGNAATSRAVTWRTDSSVLNSFAEIAVALSEPGFDQHAVRLPAAIEKVNLAHSKNSVDETVHYHSAHFDELQPDTLYAYRVGDGADHWSEWIQFRTASDQPKPFEFVYFGDAQNDVHSRWSRTIRMAHQVSPNATFALHAGDLINHADADNEWAGWFKAGSFLHAQWTGVPVMGNHEYRKGTAAEASQKVMSMLWRPQFTLPIADSLPEALHESVYTVEYQDVQVIVLNSMVMTEDQAAYLEQQLKKPGFNWRIVSFHYPIFGPTFRKNISLAPTVREEWKHLIEKYNVDFVLQGHEHSYLRGQVPMSEVAGSQESATQTMYVTSVSGPKQLVANMEHVKSYEAEKFSASRSGVNTQFFQVLAVDHDTMSYKAYTATGELYDGAVIKKDFATGKKTIREEIPATPERSFSNTGNYSKANL